MENLQISNILYCDDDNSKESNEFRYTQDRRKYDKFQIRENPKP